MFECQVAQLTAVSLLQQITFSYALARCNLCRLVHMLKQEPASGLQGVSSSLGPALELQAPLARL
jgi:hypothetical protein